MALIALSGKIGVGKNTVASIIQYLIWKNRVESGTIPFQNYNLKDFDKFDFGYQMSGWKQVSFANKLKDIVCLLIGCTRKQLEDREFKEKELGEEWWIISKPEIGMFIPYSEDSWAAHGDFEHNLIRLTPRLLLQLLGTECGRQIIHPNVWVNALMSKYEASVPYLAFKRLMGDITRKDKEFPSWIITDMRFPNEYEAVKQRGGITIRVNRYNSTCVCVDDSSLDCLTPCSRKPQHESEVALDHVTDWDYVIDNSGTIEELVEKVRTILVNEKII